MASNPTKEEKKAHYRKFPPVNFLLATTVDPEAITYQLFTKDNPEQEIILTEENIASKNLDKSVKTILIMHGWTSNLSSPWYRPVREAYFQNGSYNIIYIDWSAYASLEYKVSAACVKPLGEVIARFLYKSGIPAEQIHLIGHSLGAQLAAFIGKSYEKKYKERIGRITGLDPAGPMWSNENMKKEDKLCELDANFVDVIHTDIQLYGYTHPCGHVDYYPNGGTDQPGCPGDEEDTANCDHRRSTFFFVESINTQVIAEEIIFEENEDFNIEIRPKENPKRVVFGEHVNLQDRGVYGLETNSTKPFLK